MAEPSGDFEIVTNNKAKSSVWKHFGFVKENNEVNKSKISCRHCKIILKYSGNTSNLTDHMRRKHPAVSISTSPSSSNDNISAQKTTPLPNIQTFLNKVPASSQRARDITNSVLQFIVKDLRPFSVVENEGLRNMIKVLEPRYTIPSRQYFSDKTLPKLYQEGKATVQGDLKQAVAVALTTDGWTSCSTESYVTVTSSHIDDEWKLRSYVLQTRAMPESHTGSNIANILTEAVKEWGLPPDPALVTDNASNMLVAAREGGFTYHLGCFAHTLNLACGRALKVDRVSKLLARLRKIVAYFHRSAIASAILKEKQKMLGLPSHKLIIDVQTRWNSAVDMISRILEQQAAVYATLTCKDIRGRESDATSLSDSDITDAEELLAVLEPLKTATVALCEETVPTISIILPIQHQLLNVIMKQNPTDKPLIKQVKQAVSDDLKSRYSSDRLKELLYFASILDPRFKQVPFLSEEHMLEAYHNLTLLLNTKR